MTFTPHLQRDGVTVYAGDCLDVLRSDELGYDYRLGYAPPLIPDASVDSIVTDPPYGLEFMGKEWDAFKERPANASGPQTDSWGTATSQTGAYAATLPRFTGKQGASLKPFQDWCELWAAECLRVLKPGGHLLAFGGSRTWHRLAAAVEDAGFEIRDSIAWLYGSGFPKSLDVSKAIDKAAGVEFTARPAEGVGFMRSDGRDGYNVTKNRLDRSGDTTPAAEQWQGWGTALKPAFEPVVVARKPLVGTVAANVLTHGTGALNIDGCRIEGEPWTPVAPNKGGRSGGVMGKPREHPGGEPHAAGRWPANVILDESQAEALDQQSGTLTSGKMRPTHTTAGVNGRASAYGKDAAGGFTTMETYGDSGGASRFFPVFDFEPDELDLLARFLYVAKADASERPRVDGTAHPTVKPLALIRWLVRLVTPPGGKVLEPFAGSGTTVEACIVEGFECVAIERETTYLPLIEARISRRRDPVRAIKLAGTDGGLLSFGDDDEEAS